MKLTKIQLKLLKHYERFHAESLTLGGFVRICWLSWLALLGGAAFGCWATVTGMPAIGWLCIGLSGGAFLRDIGRFQVMFRTWPALREIISWERARELIRAHDENVT